MPNRSTTLAATFFAFIVLISCSDAQTDYDSTYKLVGNCEGCEAVFEFGERELSNTITLPRYDPNRDPLNISGVIYLADGVTPASDIILYVYHTNEDGIYPTKGDEKDWSRRHGYIRGWLKTGGDGRYTIITSKPGPYPNSRIAAHIHPIVLEPNGKYYWLKNFVFAGDPFLSEPDLNPSSPRGGSSGVLELKELNGIWYATRDFILGKNVPGY